MDETRPGEGMRWNQRQRFEFLEHRLYWEGSVGRPELASRFGISPQQASIDLATYIELVPGNVVHDPGRRIYMATSSFEPKFMRPDARQYLTQLLLIADDALGRDESWLRALPGFAAMPRLRRRLDVAILRPIVMAIHRRRAVEISYQSMTSPEPTVRWIAPHALVFDGSRWHARSWCFKRSIFSDFVLARMLHAGADRESPIDPIVDREWHEIFTIKLAPHPSLTPSQARAIEMDYGMQGGIAEIEMPLCMTYYFERHYGLDLRDDELPPARRQITLLNRDELDHARADLD